MLQTLQCSFFTAVSAITCLAQQAPSIAVQEAVAPAYPAAAAEKRTGGTVIVTARISEQGTVLDATAPKADPLLREASLNAARLWRFETQPKLAELKLTFTFRLMPKGTSEAQLGAVFRPPYAVEVRKITPEPVTHYARTDSGNVGQAAR